MLYEATKACFGLDYRGLELMAMNREQRRYLQKQGQMDSEGNVIAKRRERTDMSSERSSFREYLKGIPTELKRVTWPNRPEVVNYTIVVTITLLLMTALVAGLDIVFSEGVGALLDWGR